MSETGSLPDEALALFREPPEAFIAARNDLVAAMRAEGRADEAARVKALRKPTVVAWALNQLAVLDPEGVRALLEAGAEVRAAQQAALSSKRGATERLRTAGAARKGAVAALAAVASKALADEERSPMHHADAIVLALEASSVDPAAGSALAAGSMERPPEASAGFGDVFGLTPLEGGAAAHDEAPAPRRGSRSSTARARRTDRAQMKAEVSRLRRDRDAAGRRAQRSAEAAAALAHELEGMRRRLEVVERKHADAAASAAQAETELAKAERALRRATERLEGGIE